IMHTVFDHYGPFVKQTITSRINGVMIANQAGKASGYALFNLQERGRLLIGPQIEVYEGMVIGKHARDNDLVVNVCKEKQLTNIRASGSDENIILTPPIKLSLEQALEFIEDDELVEITPLNIRIRKKKLKEHERKRDGRA
ncbi:MAG: translational GTPase TypA, partial [Gammaproteobacteria bacterium]|nr:translational GTPase TypA [Gammaproteobacteria bacterium]